MNTLDIIQAARYLKMSTGALGQKARSGTIKAAKPGKRWVFIEEDLIEYIRSLYRPQQPQSDRGITLCHSTNAARRGGSASRLQRAKEYDAVLGHKTRNKRKNLKTD